MFIHLSALSLFTVSVIRAEYLTTSNVDGLTGLDGIDEVLQDLVEYTDYEVPETPANADIVLLETFQERDSEGKYKSAESFEKKFVRSLHGCDSDDGCKYKGSVDRAAYVEGNSPSYRGDTVLKMTQKAAFYGYTLPLEDEVDTSDDKDLVFQFEAKFDEASGCGGSYFKLLEAGSDAAKDPTSLNGDSPYSIMFGPDRCGGDKKVHFIFRHKNPITGDVKEHHMNALAVQKVPADAKNHMYTLIIKPSEEYKFEILIDGVSMQEGSLTSATDFKPPLLEPEEIKDESDEKPADWPQKLIFDPEASKPEDWDEDAPEEIPDPAVEKPEDWDDEDDGEFEAPMIKNPNYKGKWTAPMIDNPEWKGEWVQKMIPNPEYYSKEEYPEAFSKPLLSIGAVSLEVWSVEGTTAFNNIYLGRNEAAAKEWIQSTFKAKQDDEAEFEDIRAKNEKSLYLAGLKASGEPYDLMLYGWYFVQYKVQDALPFDLPDQAYLAIVVCGTILTFIFSILFCMSGGDMVDEAAAHKKDDDEGVTESKESSKDDDDEEDEEDEDEDEEEDKGNLRRRKKKSPKA